MGKLRVLLITRECLRTDSNEGNVLFGLFSGIDAECANIYCKPGLPDNSLCGGYFQLTDKMALENILHRKPMGRRVQCENGINAAQTAEVEKRGFYDFFRRHNLPVFHAARECLWSMADFRSGELDSFVRGFVPDVILRRCATVCTCLPCRDMLFRLPVVRLLHIFMMTCILSGR